MCEECNLPEIKFDEKSLNAIVDKEGNKLDDLKTPEENELAADMICQKVREFTQDDNVSLHVSIAGGRKTMGFYAGYALSLYGRLQDQLSHVLVSEKPSSFTDMAFKFFDTGRNCLPYVELKASPAKLLQGHNVFGSDDIAQGAYEMLGLLVESYPKLCSVLDFTNIEVLHIDCTFSSRLPNQNLVQPVLDFLANCGSGHRKARHVKYANYVTWGNDKASIRAKAYGKFEEVKNQMAKMQSLANKGDARSKSVYFAMNKAFAFAESLVRFEARITKTYLSKNGYPTNLWDLINYQKANPTLIKSLWDIAFNPVFNTLKGEHMAFKNDFDIEQLLREKLKTITSTGRISYTKANNAMAFYRTIRDKGFKQLHQEMQNGILAERTFYHNIKLLTDCGISRSHLQNLHESDKAKIVPFVRMVEINFNEQTPADFIEPVSKYAHYFQQAA